VYWWCFGRVLVVNVKPTKETKQLQDRLTALYWEFWHINRDLCGPDANIQSSLNPGRIAAITGFQPEPEWVR